VTRKGSKSHLSEATSSNCGEVLKLYLPSPSGNRRMARVTTFGYGNNDKDITMDNPQPSSSCESSECSSQTKCWWAQ